MVMALEVQILHKAVCFTLIVNTFTEAVHQNYSPYHYG